MDFDITQYNPKCPKCGDEFGVAEIRPYCNECECCFCSLTCRAEFHNDLCHDFDKPLAE
ncbi:MAG TPA: hypothetical protein VGN16_09530 [Acidobacteriaceae bacterium]|jgi:hypothetical protein